jgi:hypothetical protein
MASSISAGTTSSTALVATADTTGALQLATNNGTVAVTVDTSQNVGVGTASPAQKLDVNGNVNIPADSFYYLGGASDRYIRYRSSQNDVLYSGYSGLFYKQDVAGVYHAWFTGNNERMRIDSSGDVMMGGTTVTAGARLNVYQGDSSQRVVHFENTRNVSGDENLRLKLGSNCDNTSSYSFISSVGNADRLYIYGNGNVVNINNSYGSLSDAKLKENIVDATPKLTDLMQVKIRNYNLIGNTTKQIGVVAQELETVFPGMIDSSPDRDTEGNDLGTTTKSVKYSVFVPMLIKAVQELTAKVTALEAKVGASA